MFIDLFKDKHMLYYKIIAIKKTTLPLLYYRSAMEYKVGEIVSIQLINKNIKGIIIEKTENPKSKFNIKIINESLKLYISEKYAHYLKNIYDTYGLPMGEICKKTLSIIEYNKKSDYKFNFKTIKEIQLDEKQKKIYDQINHENVLITGNPGSGKTHLAFYIIQEKLKLNKKILFLLPEIFMINRICDKFNKMYDANSLMWSSKTYKKNNNDIYQSLYKDGPLLVFATRSIIFMPIYEFDLIIMDEENDCSFVQDQSFKYRTHDILNLIKSQKIFLSAIPSTYTILNNKNLKILKINKASPNIKKIFKFKDIITNPFDEEDLSNIDKSISNGFKTIIYINKRGYADTIFDIEKKEILKCNSCGSRLVYHKINNLLKCHKCNDSKIAYGKDNLIFFGRGIEKTYEILRFFDFKKVPNILILSSDFLCSKKNINKYLSDIENLNFDILITTQIFIKGYHIPEIKNIYILDHSYKENLMDTDFRNNFYCSMFQVMGRIFLNNGTIYYYKNVYNFIDNILLNGDSDYFLHNEMRMLKMFNMPPLLKSYKIYKQKPKDHSKLLNMFKNLKNILYDQKMIDIKTDIYGEYLKFFILGSFKNLSNSAKEKLFMNGFMIDNT